MSFDPTTTSIGLDPGLLDAVRDRIETAVAATPLAALSSDPGGIVRGGKMLRARLLLRLAPACGASGEVALCAAAAVELVHAASLLHDDVIDGGLLRRAEPSLWVRHGMQVAILAGDLLLCEATNLLGRPGLEPILYELIARTREVCCAEIEQELLLRNRRPDWETAVRLARQKTGALFAFSAVAACGIRGARDSGLREALREAGYRAGTAYQLADDVLDIAGDASRAGKTLGRDEARKKMTAGTAMVSDLGAVAAAVDQLREEAASLLAPHAGAEAAWEHFWSQDLAPALEAHLALVPDPEPGLAGLACRGR